MKIENEENYEGNEKKHISPTQLKTYITCGRKYLYRYVEARMPEKVHYAVPFGRAFHQTVAEINIYRKQKKKVALDIAFDWFEEFFSREIEFSETEISFEHEKKSSLIITANQMLKQYLSYLLNLESEVLNVEYEVSCPVEGTDYIFEGVIDTIERTQQNVCLVEIKTAGRMWSENDVKFDLQAPLYRNAVRETFQEDIILRYDIITRSRNVKMESRFNRADGTAHLDMMREIISGIEKGVFTPKPGYQCKGCEYMRICWEESGT
jgi:CRISPR/Cas system-associated exonuclease Cas4 (RecB family)